MYDVFNCVLVVMANDEYKKFLEKSEKSIPGNLPNIELRQKDGCGWGVFACEDIRAKRVVCYYTGCIILPAFFDAERTRVADRVMAHVLGGIHLAPMPQTKKFKFDEYYIDARNYAVLVRDEGSIAKQHIWACGGMLNSPFVGDLEEGSSDDTKCPEGNVEEVREYELPIQNLWEAKYDIYTRSKPKPGWFGYAGIIMRALIDIPKDTELTLKYIPTFGYDSECVEVFRFDKQ